MKSKQEILAECLSIFERVLNEEHTTHQLKVGDVVQPRCPGSMEFNYHGFDMSSAHIDHTFQVSAIGPGNSVKIWHQCRVTRGDALFLSSTTQLTTLADFWEKVVNT